MNHCANALLVGVTHELPLDPSAADDGGERELGCNHLECRACGARVRHANGRSVTSHHPPGEAQLATLYESIEPSTSALLDDAPRHRETRTYFCKCDWVAVDGLIRVGTLEQRWSCAGHGPEVPENRDVRVAEARRAVDALIATTVPIFVPETGAKLRLYNAGHAVPPFATAAELRDSLLGSYPEAAEIGVPLVRKDRESSAPAWGWVKDLVLMRSDWRPALGIALQHAATDGGDLAKTALVELVAHFRESVALLAWTAPMAERWPDHRPVNAPATGFGQGDDRFLSIIHHQQRFLPEVRAGKDRAFLLGYGTGGAPLIGPLTNEADLRALLVESARAGRAPGGDTGPWSWLAWTVLIGDAWLQPAFVRIVHALDHDDEAMVFALLDWFSEEQDLFELVQLLEGWVANPPPWWTTPAATVPRGWKWNMRSAHWPDVDTLGDVVTEALRRAKWQVVTPPVVDLPLLYGA